MGRHRASYQAQEGPLSVARAKVGYRWHQDSPLTTSFVFNLVLVLVLATLRWHQLLS